MMPPRRPRNGLLTAALAYVVLAAAAAFLAYLIWWL